MRTLLIDNYDSYTFNLFQLLWEVNGVEPVVVRNDDPSWSERSLRGFDNVVLSPGPGRPDRARDFGVCAAALRAATVPVLGVCLGHQGIGLLSGARVEHAPEVMHGRVDRVRHTGRGLFAGLPQGFEVVRYHSLCVAPDLPETLEPTAWCDDGVVMGVAHRARPWWGVQFHPESVCTEHGRALVENFARLSARRAGPRRTAVAPRPRRDERDVVRPPRAATPGTGAARPARAEWRVHVERVPFAVDAERAFVALFGRSENAFWLDSSRVEPGLARFSFMGDDRGPHAAVVRYDVATGTVTTSTERGARSDARTVFDHLDALLDERRVGAPDVPFDFHGGVAGYFGYELRADCGSMPRHRSEVPDAAFVVADRVVAFDHAEDACYLVCLHRSGETGDAARWAAAVRRRLASLPPLPPLGPAAYERAARFEWRRAPRDYRDDVERCRDYLRDGESYEMCLTNRLTCAERPDDLSLYRRLRRLNPAPHAAYLRFGDVAVHCSSPERFLRVGRDGWAEVKPIKGTAPRGATPAHDRALAEALRTSDKTRAENLMIVDLVRNDLGVVCDVGTVHVPHLMAVETYAGVHQLVSTVRGRLRAGKSVLDCVRACFPAGSMTGAPKLRTMELLDALEPGPRGVYSGALGYLSASGPADLNVVIRTIVAHDDRLTIGTGGAIVYGSDPDEELAETELKARAPMQAVIDALRVAPAPTRV
ncbi:MAG TPA: aminodeoxychorismate synthase component I [Actinomycetota bacterium]|nr:aminodeoxychorismate synthase component I [Actinomycetota bacterium]